MPSLPKLTSKKRTRSEHLRYSVHMNTRLTPEQAEAVRATGMNDSQGIREIIQQWMELTGIS